VNQELIWLNNCGTTPAGSHILQALEAFLEAYSRKGVLTERVSYTKVQQEIKSILARLLNCQTEELALIHNTSEGINFISHGLCLEPGDEIVLLENEYPSNIYPWYHWQAKGIILRTTPMGTSPEDFLQSLHSEISAKTRVVSLSAVHWCTGMPLPIAQVGRLCREHGIDLVIDGAQGVGMQPIDVKQSNIAYMAFSAWKWLMGPLGVGGLYISKEKLDELKPVFMGTSSVVKDREYLPYKSDLKPTADRFTISTANFNDWVYFLTALKYLDSIGFETVRNRLFELAEHLNAGLRTIGFRVLADRFASHPTAITVCEKPGIPAPSIMQHLKENKIVAAERLGAIRFSPHIYNSRQQLDDVVQVLEDV
jgi:selenocysteine lyase/cysteine desulfurase